VGGGVDGEVVAAYLQGVGGGGDRAGVGGGGDLGAVDVEAQGGAVVGLGQIAPGVGGQGGRAVGVAVGAAGDQAGVGFRGIGRGGFEVVVVVALVDHVPPDGGDGRRVHPGLERHP